jgi:hypothetical protein
LYQKNANPVNSVFAEIFQPESSGFGAGSIPAQDTRVLVVQW